MIRNFTPHTVVILDKNNNVMKRLPSEGYVRIETSFKKIAEREGIPITEKTRKVIGELPPPAFDTYYIVSIISAEAMQERSDLLIPDDMVYDDNGKPIGCKSLRYFNGGK